MSDEPKGSGINEMDTAKLTDSSPREVATAFHGAQDDAQAAGEIERSAGSGEPHAEPEEIEAQSLSGLQEAMAETDSDAPDNE